MKNFKATLFFAVFVVGVAAFSFWDYQNSKEEKIAEEKADLVLKLDKTEITEVTLESPDRRIQIQKQDGTWKLIQPLEDEVDGSAVDFWLTDLLGQKAKDLSAQVGVNPDWSKYHFSDQSPRIQVKAGDRIEELSFGTSNAFDGSYYIRQGDKLLLGETTWASSLEKRPEALRNKDLYEPDGEIDRIQIKNHRGENFELAFADGQWKIPSSPDLTLSTRNIEDFIENLKELKAVDISADEVTSATKKKYALNSPTLELKISEQDREKPYQITIGRIDDDKQEAYVWTSRRETIYRLSKVAAEKVLVGKDYFRDGHKPFRIEWSKVDKVQIEIEGQLKTFNKSGENWNAAGLKEKEEFKPEKMENFLLRLKELEAKVYLPAKSGKGFNQKITLFQQDQPLLTVEIGDGFDSPQVATHINPLRYVRSSLSSEVLGVRDSVVQGLMRELPLGPKMSHPNEEKAEKTSSSQKPRTDG